jgi:ubiquinol-cytochrome c reductase cytochrome b subunit
VGAAQAGRMPVIGPEIARFILAGDTIGGATLSRFFAFHVFFIPAIVFGFIGLHLMLVLRHGISERTRDGEVVDPGTYRAHYDSLLKREGIPFWPDAAWRDVVFGAAMVATIVALALIVGPPALSAPPDPSILEAYPRPDWYFLWYFAVLALAPHHLETIIMVAGPLLFGAALLLPAFFNRGHRSVRRRPWAALLVVFMWVTIVSFWVAGERADWSPDFAARPLPATVVRSERPEVVEGARLFHAKGCEFCHAVEGFGGRRGPDLSDVRSRMAPDQIAARITNGSANMPAYARTLTPPQVQALVAFLSTRGP